MLSTVEGRAVGNHPAGLGHQRFANNGSPDMESAKSGHRTVSGRTQARKNDREGKTNPRSRALNRSDRASEFAKFARRDSAANSTPEARSSVW